uniref:Protein kinase domain-containing protein n=1 Tax=Chromera velia CCMP2878 TaxID=1169474 RepID=A0A0G4IDN3_9ALVE|eukprot:Cvel_13338.t1-p1 / transcript=Cvel_13338.t1 / gene=Cvel_13338 / organism=Chromera_velia_CCMP2878 / gene_product=hypothetical protein / transcript_product=hypothetical protein / location=Cvel_scaffold906:10922-14368(+) / protein_length=431 / sequence_SO=supercontig / SO=protein_coding / is_pseudo=false
MNKDHGTHLRTLVFGNLEAGIQPKCTKLGEGAFGVAVSVKGQDVSLEVSTLSPSRRQPGPLQWRQSLCCSRQNQGIQREATRELRINTVLQSESEKENGGTEENESIPQGVTASNSGRGRFAAEVSPNPILDALEQFQVTLADTEAAEKSAGTVSLNEHCTIDVVAEEGDIQAKYGSENVVRAIGWAADHLHFFLVMEKMGPDLGKAMWGGGSVFSWKKRVATLKGVFAGLLEMHSGEGGKPAAQHRDLKTVNVLTGDGEEQQAKLADLGMTIGLSGGGTGEGKSAWRNVDKCAGRVKDEKRGLDIFVFRRHLAELFKEWAKVEGQGDEAAKTFLEQYLDPTAQWPLDIALGLFRLSLKCTSDKFEDRVSAFEGLFEIVVLTSADLFGAEQTQGGPSCAPRGGSAGCPCTHRVPGARRSGPVLSKFSPSRI